MMRPSISHIFINFLESHPASRVKLGDLVDALGHRGQAILLLLLSLPNALLLSTIPGVSTIFGLPMCFVALQMLINLPNLWIPMTLRNKEIDRSTLDKIVQRSCFYLVKIERYIQPRFTYFTYGFFSKIIAFFLVILSVIIALPIPFGNFFGGWGVVLLSMAVIERDGIVAIFGMVYTVTFVWVLVSVFDKLLSLILG
jgi:hypothetical protein